MVEEQVSALLHLLGAGHLIDTKSLAMFADRCQFKYGGICKVGVFATWRGGVVDGCSVEAGV